LERIAKHEVFNYCVCNLNFKVSRFVYRWLQMISASCKRVSWPIIKFWKQIINTVSSEMLVYGILRFFSSLLVFQCRKALQTLSVDKRVFWLGYRVTVTLWAIRWRTNWQEWAQPHTFVDQSGPITVKILDSHRNKKLGR
jgi:hypothetical protein